MRKAVLGFVGIGIAALTLSGCAPATSGGGGGAAGGASDGSSAPAVASASGPSGKIAMCSAFTAAALSAASGKTFGETLETDNDGVYGCAYELSGDAGDWIVDVQEPSDGDDPTTDGLDLGGSSAVKPVTGTGYTTVASKAGVELQVGKDVVEVYTPATAPGAQATTNQFVKVAKAVIAAISK